MPCLPFRPLLSAPKFRTVSITLTNTYYFFRYRRSKHSSFTMMTPSLSSLVAFAFLACNAMAALRVQHSSDNSQWWEEETSGGHPSPNQLRSLSESKFGEMTREAAHEGLARPSTMAALWVSGHGTILASSIIGQGAKQSQNTQALNVCSTRYHGNCAEMNAIALAQHLGWNLQGASIAVFGYDKHTDTNHHFSPCADANGRDGCGGVLVHYDIHAITKRALAAIEFMA